MAAECRVQRVSRELQKIIALLLRTRINDPNLASVTITEIYLSRDLSYAKVYYTCLSADDSAKSYIVKYFEKSKGFFRSSIAKKLNLRIVPNLKFIYDNSLDYGMEMEYKIQKALNSDSRMILNKDNNSFEENYKYISKSDKFEKLR